MAAPPALPDRRSPAHGRSSRRRDHLAGAITLLFGPSTERLCHLTPEQLKFGDKHAHLLLGRHPVLLLPRLAELLRQLAEQPELRRAERGGQHKDPDREPRRRRRATYNRPHGVRHLFAALDLSKDRLYSHINPIKKRTQFLEFCRYLRGLYPPEVRIAIVADNFSPHLTTKKCQRVGTWAAANNVEIAYTPTNSSWLNRIEAQFTALRYFTLDGTDHASHKEQGSMIRRYIIWRNRHADDRRLRAVVDRANVA